MAQASLSQKAFRPGLASVQGHRWALVGLLRSGLVSRPGARLARGIGIGLAIWFAVAAWLEARGPDGDGWTSGIAARATAVIVSYAGSVAALSLAAVSKTTELESGIRALAKTRAVSERAFRLGEVLASIRVIAEIVALPSLIVAIACALLSSEKNATALLPIGGAAVFGGVAAIVLGSLSSACRNWGGARSRSSLLAITILPWIVGNALLEGRGGEYVSIPGLLSWSWRLLTGAPG